MSKSSTNRERREAVEKLRREALAAERRRTTVVVAICVVIALIIVGAATYAIVKSKNKDKALANTPLDTIGVTQAAASCAPIVEKDATGQQQHTTQPVTYPETPPSYGNHNPTPDTSGLHFYTAGDRPPVEVLVHNLEHGWTIIWYDDSVAKNKTEFDAINKAADIFGAHGTDPKYNVIFAPWTSKDQGGGVIPDGKHYAIVHWSVHMGSTYDPTIFSTAAVDSKSIPSWGESEYCSSFSGAALQSFIDKYPYDDAPEGFLWHQSQ